jgi:type IV secretory pathway TraG/TraD family ATPase VirD4
MKEFLQKKKFLILQIVSLLVFVAGLILLGVFIYCLFKSHSLSQAETVAADYYKTTFGSTITDELNIYRYDQFFEARAWQNYYQSLITLNTSTTIAGLVCFILSLIGLGSGVALYKNSKAKHSQEIGLRLEEKQG